MSKPVNCTIKNPARSEGGISGNWVTAAERQSPARGQFSSRHRKIKIRPKTYLSLTNARAAAGKDQLTVGNRTIVLESQAIKVWKNSHHGQGAPAADLGRYHRLRRLGCCCHDRQRFVLRLDADGPVSAPNRFYQFL